MDRFRTLIEKLGGRGRRGAVAVGVVAVALIVVVSLSLLAKPEAGVVARVNGEAITEQQLYEQMVRRVGPQLLDQMIERRLIQQAADLEKVTVGADEVAAELSQIQSQFDDEADFQSALEQANISVQELEDDIRWNLLIMKLLHRQVSVGEEEIEAFFAENRDLLDKPEQIRARHILVRTEEEARDVLGRLKAGEDFAELARTLSVDTKSGEQGGDLGWFARGEMVPEFDEAAWGLAPGQVSEAVQTQFGYHIIRVDERQEAKEAVYEEVREEIRRYLEEEAIQGLYQSWVRGLRTEAKVETFLPGRR